MKRIAVLGPSGTYSDIAADKFINGRDGFEFVYCPTIQKTAKELNNCDYVVLPFENTLDGFVIESLDQLIRYNLNILSQLKLDIDFAFVTNAKSIKDVKKCYAQFKVQGQCIDFIEENTFELLTTQSNSESVNLLLDSDDSFGAIIPMHRLEDTGFKTIIKHVADKKSNETRFFLCSKEPTNDYMKLRTSEASVLVTSSIDRPGILFDILKEFHDCEINLKSIMSRPMKTEIGKYKFYLECSLPANRYEKLSALQESLSKLEGMQIRILGIYNTL